MEKTVKTKISFKLQNQDYAFDSLKVRNILPYEDNITSVPNTPTHILGVLNLHGNIIPIVDMRLVMGIEEKEVTKDTTIIILSPENIADTRFGVLVDKVNEVFEVDEDIIKPAAFEKGMGIIERFEGTLHIEDTYIHLIDISHLNDQLNNIGCR